MVAFRQASCLTQSTAVFPSLVRVLLVFPPGTLASCVRWPSPAHQGYREGVLAFGNSPVGVGMSADEEFEETVSHGEGGQEEGAAVAAGAPGGARGETPSGSPWWAVWCDRIGAGEEGLDATRTNLALQLPARPRGCAYLELLHSGFSAVPRPIPVILHGNQSILMIQS